MTRRIDPLVPGTSLTASFIDENKRLVTLQLIGQDDKPAQVCYRIDDDRVACCLPYRTKGRVTETNNDLIAYAEMIWILYVGPDDEILDVEYPRREDGKVSCRTDDPLAPMMLAGLKLDETGTGRVAATREQLRREVRTAALFVYEQACKEKARSSGS